MAKLDLFTMIVAKQILDGKIEWEKLVLKFGLKEYHSDARNNLTLLLNELSDVEAQLALLKDLEQYKKRKQITYLMIGIALIYLFVFLTK